MTTEPTPTLTSTSAHSHINTRERLRLRVISKIYLHPRSWKELLSELDAAETRGLGIRVENMADDDGNVAIELTLYADPLEVDASRFDDWWPHPDEWMTVERHRASDGERLGAFSDPRWGTHQARAAHLVRRHDPGCQQAHRMNEPAYGWLVDFSDQLLGPDLDYSSFPHEHDAEDD